LKNHYLAGNGYVFAKTGSLTGVICLSGYVYTVKNTCWNFYPGQPMKLKAAPQSEEK